jgi:hypothetical protein
MAGWKFFINNIQVNEPIGWDAIEFTAIRLESHGIDQPFSTEISFSGKPGRYANGAKILKEYFDNGFINDQIPFQITSNQNIDGNLYDFQGIINMALYSEQNTCDTQGWQITVGIIENNFQEIFKSRSDVDIDLTTNTDLDGNAIDPLTEKQIRLHRQDLYLQANGKNLADSSTYLYNGPLGAIAQRFAVVPTYWQQNDFKDNYGSVFNTNAIFVTRANWETTPILKNNGSVTRTWNYEVKIEFELRNNTSNNIQVELYFLKLDGNVPITPATSLYSITLTSLQVVNVNQTFTGSFTVETGRTISLFFGQNTFDTASTPVTVNIEKGYTINLNEVNSGEFASTANCLTIEQWLRRAIYIMTGSNDKLLSDTFSESGDGCYWNNALTNGLRLRQADGTNNLGALKTSWEKVFEDLNRIFCLGWGFEWTGTEWKIRVEKLEYFYQTNIIQTFNKVSNITQTASVDLIKNSIILGFTETWKNIQLSGVFAIHTDRNYFVANRAMSQNSTDKLDLRSGIIGEGYAIEFSRRLSGITFGGASSDRPNDYETFIIWLNRSELTINPVQNSRYNLPQESGSVTFDPGEISWNSDYITYSSLPFGGLYNIFHTPARIAFRWWKYLGMNTFGLANPMLRFQVGQYQTNYISNIASAFLSVPTEPCREIDGVLDENINIDPQLMIYDKKFYLFKPIELEFSVPQSLCSFIDMANNGIGIIKMTSGNQSFYGFLQNATNKPVDPKSGISNFKLLLANNVPYVAGFSEGFSDGFG